MIILAMWLAIGGVIINKIVRRDAAWCNEILVKK
jgi:hypothetical protein